MRPHWPTRLEVLILIPGSSRPPRSATRTRTRSARPVRVVRIDAPSTTRHARLVARHEPGPDRDWHLARTDVLAVLLVTAGVEDLVVSNDDRSPSVVAAEIADALGL